MRYADISKLWALTNELDEGYRLFRAYDPDGACKSAEGAVSLQFGTTWDRLDGHRPVTVSVYSYVFGPSRSHDFPDLDTALKEVREWVANYRDWLLCPTCGEPKAAGNGWDEDYYCGPCAAVSL